MKLQFLDSFNTGALYSSEGQRIGLWLILDDDAPELRSNYFRANQYRGILLVDFDRYLDYVVLPPRSMGDRSKTELIEYSMRSYLWNENLVSRYGMQIYDLPAMPQVFPRRMFG